MRAFFFFNLQIVGAKSEKVIAQEINSFWFVFHATTSSRHVWKPQACTCSPRRSPEVGHKVSAAAVPLGLDNRCGKRIVISQNT
jgi:hypothetical protein